MRERPADWDEDDHALADAVEMVGRTGAKSITIGWLVDDPPPDVANWYASAEFRAGTMVTDPQMTPRLAAEALADILRSGARCRFCGKRIAWGARRKSERQRWCLWTKAGGGWVRGCPATTPKFTERP